MVGRSSWFAKSNTCSISWELKTIHAHGLIHTHTETELKTEGENKEKGERRIILLIIILIFCKLSIMLDFPDTFSISKNTETGPFVK